eukprot:tig00020604_g11847.t1
MAGGGAATASGSGSASSASTAPVFDRIQQFLRAYGEHPELFVGQLPESSRSDILSTVKLIFDFAKKHEDKPFGPLPELLVDGFDVEQIWEEIQLQNAPVLQYAEKRVGGLLKSIDEISLIPEGLALSDDEKDAASGSGAGGEDEEDEGEADGEDDGEDEAGKGASGEEEDDDDAAFDAAMARAAKEKRRAAGEEEEEGEGEEEAEAAPGAAGMSKSGKRPRIEGLEDDFFDLDEMEEFCQQAEEEAARERAREERRQKKGDEDEEDEENEDEDEGDEEEDEEEEELDDDDLEMAAEMEDMEEDGEDEEEEEEEEGRRPRKRSGKEARYEDFFDAPRSGRPRPVRGEEEEEESGGAKAGKGKGKEAAGAGEAEAGAGPATAAERRAARIKSQIAALEDFNVGEKPWHLAGEVSARERPVNSLLEAQLEFDHANKPAPVVTQETTSSLEEAIKRRILDAAFDDVVRKKAPDPNRRRRTVELDHEKSKEGLGSVYEKEYVAAAQGATGDAETRKKREEIDVCFTKLCAKLDALSNFHFTPKPDFGALEVKANAPAIAMEEAVPLAVSEGALLAPEEVYAPPKRLKGDAERTGAEKKRERADRKRSKAKEKRRAEADRKVVEKANPGMGNKYSKERALEELRKAGGRNVVEGKEVQGGTKKFTQSKEFFKNLQASTDAAAAGARPAKRPRGGPGEAPARPPAPSSSRAPPRPARPRARAHPAGPAGPRACACA